MNPETRDWLDCFKLNHGLSTREEAIEKLIEIYKAWNKNGINKMSI